MRDPSLASLSAEQLDQFRAAILTNVESLYLDARLLMENGRYARAMSLAILAREELAKLVPVWVVRSGLSPLGLNELVDLREHSSKLLLALVMDVVTRLALTDADEDAVRSTMKNFVAEGLSDGGERLSRTVRRTNALKQYGFYVAWTVTEPRSASPPDKLFTEDDARPFVNILINHLLFAYPCDAAVSMVARGVRSVADISPEDLGRMASEAEPHVMRVLSYLRPA